YTMGRGAPSPQAWGGSAVLLTRAVLATAPTTREMPLQCGPDSPPPLLPGGGAGVSKRHAAAATAPGRSPPIGQRPERTGRTRVPRVKPGACTPSGAACARRPARRARALDLPPRGLDGSPGPPPSAAGGRRHPPPRRALRVAIACFT